jgi:hypothetical protein
MDIKRSNGRKVERVERGAWFCTLPQSANAGGERDDVGELRIEASLMDVEIAGIGETSFSHE